MSATKKDMDMNYLCKMGNQFSNKRGVSGVITVVILVGLVMVTTAIVWTVVNGLVSDRIGDAEACFGNFEKVTLNNRYTCYDSSSNETMFSINIGDIEVDSVIVSISSEGATKGYTITDEVTNIEGLTNYSGGDDVIIPGKNSGLTYIATEYSSEPDSINIKPVINGKQCDISDSIIEIDSCS